jgi:hypothetical protein
LKGKLYHDTPSPHGPETPFVSDYTRISGEDREACTLAGMKLFQKLFQSRRNLSLMLPTATDGRGEAGQTPDTSWPEGGRRAFRVPFLPHPRSVLKHFESTLPPLQAIYREYPPSLALPEEIQQEINHRSRFYAVGLEALLFNLPREEMPPRKSVFQDFCAQMEKHVESCPFLLRHGGVVTYLDLLTRDLQTCGDEDLAACSGRLREKINTALL